MSKKITKTFALQLIQYCKKIECVANIHNPKSKSCIEFAKQMMSSKLKKKNPILECQMYFHEESHKPFVHAQFTDGKTWTIETDEISAADIRYQFYTRAELAEEAAEEAEGDFSMDEGGKAKGAASKPAAKPAGKK